MESVKKYVIGDGIRLNIIKNEKETDVLCVKCKNKSGAHCFW